DPALIDYFYRRGVRYVTLAHTADNDICDSSTDRKDPEDRGLSDWGRQVVRRLNELGVMVDVSHISDRSFFDVLALTRAPVMASHSCARALCRQPAQPERRDAAGAEEERRRHPALHPRRLHQAAAGESRAATRPSRAFWKKVDETYGGWGNIKDKAVRDRVETEYDALARPLSAAAGLRQGRRRPHRPHRAR
ncbi:MAG: dipeptidase, partial [Rhodopseudomonas palustris]|nr:dipeptidase [Rhodopseudomonas palustris]